MWAIVAPLIIKYGIPLALKILERTGAINGVEALVVKGWVASKDIHASYKPEDFPYAPAPLNTNRNFNN